MTQSVLILGANGRFGRATTTAFAQAGWRVLAATRDGTGPAAVGVRRIACDVTDQARMIEAANGVDVIVHAVHPPYPKWATLMPVHTANIIAAGLSSGATVMIPGNVYGFGAHARTVLQETDPPAPTTRKGALRVAMEQAFEAAAEQGLRTVILRGGDFLERSKSGNWFDRIIAAKTDKGKFSYPGRMDAVHAWAYLPDMARAMVALAAKRASLPVFARFGFEGFSLTGAELKAATAEVAGRPLRQSAVPWWVIRLAGVFSPLMYEMIEMRYLWDTPHRIDGAPLKAVLTDFSATPLAPALADVMASEQPDAHVKRAQLEPRSA